ncbi:MAG: hypothetical protein JNK54_08110 [Elusimicrobia bacterium]|nr:hypothetical protein [Elusimicrobiota bacterium]
MTNKGLGVFIVLLVSLTHAGDRPSPEELLDMIFTPPRVTYRATALTTLWRDGRGITEEVRVYYRPSGEMRREFIGNDGKIVRVVVSDGKKEVTSVEGRRQRLQGRAPKTLPRAMSAQSERALLLDNYHLARSSDQRVAGHLGWGITLTPVSSGKPHQLYVVDGPSGVLIRVRRFLPGEDLAVQTVLLDLETNVILPENLFLLSADEFTLDHGLDPNFTQTLGASTETKPPVSLGEGFVLDSMDSFDIGQDNVHVERYTDGLAVLSLYKTSHPMEWEDPSAPTSPLKSIHWVNQGTCFTLVGDLSAQALEQISLLYRNTP